ncbi:hypothetical protein KPL74_08550 [Bacillus sp. NP157]|nr:hypothetical protein KPL74_08550 [Bacillus sp. NP157]
MGTQRLLDDVGILHRCIDSGDLEEALYRVQQIEHTADAMGCGEVSSAARNALRCLCTTKAGTVGRLHAALITLVAAIEQLSTPIV